MLVEGSADEKQLAAGQHFSWEHGLVARTRNPVNPSTRQPVNFFAARGEADAPDIDGRVYVRGKLPIGEFARVKIVGHTDYDLIAEPV